VRNRLGLASGLALAYSLALLGDQMLYVFLPSQPAAAGIAAASLGIILSANRFVRLGANSLAGLLSDRLGRRRPYLLGMLLALASTAGYLVSDGFWPLLLSRVVWGIAFALIHVVGAAIILDVSTDEDRGRTVGSYSSLAQLGTLIGLLLSGFLTDLMGYRGTLMVYVPLAVVGIVVALLVLRDRDSEPMRRPAVARGGLGTLAALRDLDRRLLAPAYVNFVSLFAGSGVVAATLGLYLKQLASEPEAGLLVPIASLTGLLLAGRRLAGMIEAPLAGQLLDRFGDRRAVTALGALVSLVGFVVLAGGRGVGMVVLGVALMAIGEGFIGPAVVVWTGDNAPPHLRGVIVGGLATSGDLGAAIGPLVGYALLETAGLRAAYALCVALMLSALLVLVFVRGHSGSTPRPSPTRSLI
jgi:DHA1 family multidrug resistance protein-like MFS transporter